MDEAEKAPAEQALDFDRVEAAPSMSCAGCKRPIDVEYYEINRSVVCAACHAGVLAELTGPVGGRRLFRAALRGFIASLFGSLLWYAVTTITGYELGLIAVVVGVMVGMAVKKGARGRGGWQFQAIAIFFTYASIVGSYMPAVWHGLKEGADKPKQSAPKDPAAKDPTATKDPAADEPAKDPTKVPTPSFFKAVGVLILAVLVLFAIACVAPFLGGLQNLLGLLIIGFALWEAWKINKRPPLQVGGPFRVGATATG